MSFKRTCRGSGRRAVRQQKVSCERSKQENEASKIKSTLASPPPPRRARLRADVPEDVLDVVADEGVVHDRRAVAAEDALELRDVVALVRRHQVRHRDDLHVLLVRLRLRASIRGQGVRVSSRAKPRSLRGAARRSSGQRCMRRTSWASKGLTSLFISMFASTCLPGGKSAADPAALRSCSEDKSLRRKS